MGDIVWIVCSRAHSFRGATLIGMTLLLLMLTGCGSVPQHLSSETPIPKPIVAPTVQINPVVAVAQKMVGIAYRWGGESPAEGFDCSGLVRYAYGRLGVSLPRTAKEQYHELTRITARDLTPGDLVFFTPLKTRNLHVGIYVGDERFLHAPSRGKRIGYAHLTSPYWQSCFVGGRRVPGIRERLLSDS
jgi:cell wall-associated NlpC family hydrolase